MSNIKKKFRETYDRLMDLPDAPNKIAGGVGLGVAMDFLPIPIISIPISFIVARAVGLNGLAAALTAMMFKVIVPIFYAINIMVGKLILSGHAEKPQAVNIHFELTSPEAWIIWLKSLGKTFLLGASINSILAFIIVYFVFRKFMVSRQNKFQQKQNSSQHNDE